MSDGSKGRAEMTAGLDLGDKYSYLCLIVCLIDTDCGEVVEEGRLRTTPEAFRRRFSSERPLPIAIEAGTHSPWASRILEECGHEVGAGSQPSQDEADLHKQAQNRRDRRREPCPPVTFLDPKLCSTRSSTGVKSAKLTWRSSARVRLW
jgi:transposase